MYRRSPYFLIFIFPLLLLPLPLLSQPLELRLNVERHELRNGLQILTLEDHDLPVLSYYTFYRVGSRDENAGATGIAHLLEHLMFNGARRYGPKEFDQVLEANGGFGNAYTTEDMTVYHESVPSDRLKLIVDLESDRMVHLQLTEDGLAKERNVVKEERRLRTDNSVTGGVFELLHATAYTAHSYQWPVIGWMSDLDQITIEQTRAFYESYYTPENAVVVIVGDFDTNEAIRLLKTFYGPIRSRVTPIRQSTIEPGQYGERRANLHKYAELPAVAVAYHAPAAQNVDVYALDLFQMILAQGESSRLHRRLVYEEQVALSVSATYPWMLDPALFTLYVTVTENSDPDYVESMIYEEIDRFRTEQVEDKELQKAKNILTASFIKDLETSSGKADRIGNHEILFGDWSAILSTPDFYESVTKDDIQRVVSTYFSERNRTVITMLPEVR
ncbi:MAG: insulinase family protein [Candidatus Latescibacteria bacterium]|nr:insulinase family protein [Candidatus Latescibacterota bacterium]